MARDTRHLTAYEVIEAQVSGHQGSFRGMVSRRLSQGYELWGSPYFFYKHGKLWGIQAVINYAIRQGRKDVDSSEENIGRVVGFAAKPTATISRKKEKTKQLHQVRSFCP